MSEGLKILIFSGVIAAIACLLAVRWDRDLRFLQTTDWNFEELQKARPRQSKPDGDTGAPAPRPIRFYLIDPALILFFLIFSFLIFSLGRQ
ncbi:MAG: hypothetical protein ABJA10_04565 [Aestuariivirga sp.]